MLRLSVRYAMEEIRIGWYTTSPPTAFTVHSLSECEGASDVINDARTEPAL